MLLHRQAVDRKKNNTTQKPSISISNFLVIIISVHNVMKVSHDQKMKADLQLRDYLIVI